MAYAVPDRPGYTVRLDVFEGPLDLLLHLIRREEMDIRDIPIARITEQYLEYLASLGSLDLDRASEFLLMAATLMDIKSRLLLPRPPAEQFIDEEAQADPRQELVARLLEYKRYKEAAAELARRADKARKSHSRFGGPGGPLPPPAVAVEDRAGGAGVTAAAGPVNGGDGGTHLGTEEARAAGTAGLAGVTLSDLVAALQNVLRELEGRPEVEIARETLSVSDVLGEIVPLLLEAGCKGLEFTGLLRRARSRRDAIVTFLALIELLRQGRARFAQEAPFGPIMVWGLPGLGEWGWPGRD